MFLSARFSFEPMLFVGVLSYVACSIFLSLPILDHIQYTSKLKKNGDEFHKGDKSAFVVPMFTTSSDEFRHELTLRLMAAVMNADKEERVAEMEVVNRYANMAKLPQAKTKIKNYLKDNYAIEDIAYAAYWWFEKSDIELLKKKKKKYREIDNRPNILAQLIAVAYADGDLCEDEEYLLRYIAYHMHLTEAEYNKAIRDFCKKTDNYDDSYEKWTKARYRREGGYWFRDRNGRKQWYSFENESKSTNGNTNNEGNTTPSMSAELQKAYAVLGLSVDATPSEINACKRNLLRLNHPDLVAVKGQEAVNVATAKCQQINQAYELLRANGKC